MKNLNTVLVTGSGRGIGREIAVLLAAKGLNVIVCSRTQTEINNVLREIKSPEGGKAMGKRCDVSIASDVNNLVEEVLKKYGRIDVLINNAVISYVKKLIDTTEKEWDQTLDINLKGPFLLCKASVPHMMKNNLGVIINVSSGAGKVGFEDISAYCASKFGLMGLTESLTWEVANYNIRVMTICPGEVATKMQENVDSSYYQSNKDNMIQPKTVAEKIVEMVFDYNKYRNGISVDLPN
jgi:3-oxoacyl-[acyl-carrier protein] reductase